MKGISILLILFFFAFAGYAQNEEEAQMTREEILNMSVDELSGLSFEELIQVMDVMGVSSKEELTNLLINKNVSSASKKMENAFDSPLSSSVLTKEEIELSGATTIEEALRLVPGVIVREKTNGNYDIHLRGLDNLPPKNMLLYSENTNTLLMVDGRPMFNYAHGAIVWETLPIGIEDVDRIEVIRGAAGALYGPNAVNGVINILTEDPSSESSLVSGDVQVGTQDTYTGNLALRNSWDNGLSAAVTTNFQSRQRNRDEIFVFENGRVESGFYDIEEYDDLSVDGLLGERSLLAPEFDVDELFPDPGLARENYGFNTFLNYKGKSDFSLDLSAGYQDSYVNSSRVGDTPSSFSGRKSQTGYGNLMAAIGDLTVQANYMGGTQDFALSEAGFKVDMGQFNASVDYNWQIKRLNLRPGISYQTVFYDDTPNLEEGEMGYFNGKKELNTLATSLRAEFLAFGKLRLISALRFEKYNYPDQWQPSWQFAGTYPISENTMVRAVYSRANRSSFIINSQSDYLWDRSSRNMFPQEVHFGGNKDYDLMTTDMVEVGFRTRPARNVLIDTEFFISENRDFGALLPYYSTVAFPMDRDQISYASVGEFAMQLQQGQVLPAGRMNMLYQNMKLNARQTGASFNVDWIISDKWIAKFHGTFQKTVLDDYSDWNTTKTASVQLDEASQKFEQLVGGILQGQVSLPLDEGYPEMTASYAQNTDLQDDVEHESTPSFWGMLGLTYKPTEQVTISSYGYYLGEQTMINQYATASMDPKMILNAKASYMPGDHFEFFLNARNLLDDDTREFAFMDRIGGLYLAGIRFSY